MFSRPAPTSQRNGVWDPARPAPQDVRVGPDRPRYLPVPDRPVATSSPRAVLHAAYEGNLNTAGNISFIEPGQERDSHALSLATDRRLLEERMNEVNSRSYRGEVFGYQLPFLPEDEHRVADRQRAMNRFRAMETRASMVTHSAMEHGEGITFNHRTMATPYQRRRGQGSTMSLNHFNNNAGSLSNADLLARAPEGSGYSRSRTFSAASADWGSNPDVRRPSGQLHVANPGSSVAPSEPTLSRVSTNSTISSTAANAYYDLGPRPPLQPPPAALHRRVASSSSSSGYETWTAPSSSGSSTYQTAPLAPRSSIGSGSVPDYTTMPRNGSVASGTRRAYEAQAAARLDPPPPVYSGSRAHEYPPRYR